MKKITVYSTPTCIFCNALKEWLDDQEYSYEVIDVSDPKNSAEAEKTLGHSIEGVPVSLVGDQEIVGFDRAAFKKALKEEK